jgi:hypothetical protein
MMLREHRKRAPTPAQYKPEAILNHFFRATIGTIGNRSS